jgi:hypothetical protein
MYPGKSSLITRDIVFHFKKAKIGSTQSFFGLNVKEILVVSSHRGNARPLEEFASWAIRCSARRNYHLQACDVHW